MSVRRVDYVMVACKINPRHISEEIKDVMMNDYNDDLFKEGFNKNQIKAIYDGMNGKYIFIGFILQKSIYEMSGIDSIDMGKIDVDKYANQIDEFMDKLKLKRSPISLWVFSHFH